MISWTSNIAYAIGLITTDGNLSKDRRHISLKWIRQCIKNALGINRSLSGWRSRRDNDRKVAWTLRFCKNDSLIFFK